MSKCAQKTLDWRTLKRQQRWVIGGLCFLSMYIFYSKHYFHKKTLLPSIRMLCFRDWHLTLSPPLYPTQAPSDSRAAINSSSSTCHLNGLSFASLERKVEQRGSNDQFSGQTLGCGLLFCSGHILKNVPGNTQAFHPTNLVLAANMRLRVWRGHCSQRLLRPAGQKLMGEKNRSHPLLGLLGPGNRGWWSS